MKKKTKAKIASSVNDIIFSEIDLKETTFNNKDVVYYSLDIMSDNSSNSPRNSDNSSNNSPNSGSFNLDDYDLNIDDLSDDLNDQLNEQLNNPLNIKNISIKNSSDSFINNFQEEENLNVSKIDNSNNIVDLNEVNEVEEIDKIDKIDEIDEIDEIDDIDEIIKKNEEVDKISEKCEETKTKLNTSEFFKILNQNQNQTPIISTIPEEDIINNEISKTLQEEILKNENQEQNINENTINNTINNDTKIEPENTYKFNIPENKQNENNIENQDILNVNESTKQDDIKENLEEIQQQNQSKKSIEDLQNMNTQEKVHIWKDLIDTNINAYSSYNYLQTETQNNNLLNLINKDRLFKFYKLAEKNNKNIYGYIDNNKIYNCEPNTTYDFEVHTKLTNENIDPPGNYINIFMKKDLDKIKCVYLLNSNGYWTMEPLENFQSFKDNETKQKILLIYFIILKILFCNKYYPFNDGNSIQKYRNLTKNINLNIINHINNNNDFKNYINTQFKNVFKLNDTIEDIIKLITDNNINKYYGRILKLKYKYY
jgi:hypothetical protein